MKKSLLLMVLFSVLYANGIAQDANVQKKDPVGKWKFEAPAAKEGYTAGTMIISLAENKYSAGVIFSNFEYKFPGEKVKFVNDSLSFVVSIPGQMINYKLKIEDPAKMSGKAFFPEGPVSLLLTRIPN
ncbi:MAG: hypothetical protein NT092_12550 [Bacteroidia bacterium]|nr:hypothetical protein [Bacteroidia bacterium]